jgi:hypothetical protein
MLYFDQIEDRFGRIGQQIWTMFHFPLHLAMLLTVEGSTKLITWSAVVQRFPNISHIQSYYNTTIADSNATIVVERLNKTLTSIKNTIAYEDSTAAAFNFTIILNTIAGLDLRSEQGLSELSSLLDEVWAKLMSAILTTFEVTASFKGVNPPDAVQELSTLFSTVFFFFFIAAGFVLISLGVLCYFKKHLQLRRELAPILLRIVPGFGLALVTTVYASSVIFEGYLASPWLIPTVVLTFFIG